MERFVLLEPLGSGVTAPSAARDTALDIEVAVKVLARTEGLNY